MFGFKEKKKGFEEEDLCCRFCEYAAAENEKLFCRKKKKETQEDGCCSSFAYDLLKRRPSAMKKKDLSELEFPVI